MRKHYLTICTHGDIVVTHIHRANEPIIVDFERAVKNGFGSLGTTIDGQIIKREGFNDAEVDFLLRFLKNNKRIIISESLGEK